MLSRRELAAMLALRAVRGQEKDAAMFGDAEAYDRFMGRWSRLLAPLLLEFADIPDEGRVLDAGSGTGSMASAITSGKARCQVVGIDPSKEYVAYAASRNRDGARANFETGDAQHLRFADGTFQSCLSLLVFNFIPDPALALRELVRVTRPGGRIAAAVWDYGTGMRMLRVFWDAVISLNPEASKYDEGNMPLCRVGELSSLWTKGGLTGVEERPLEITMRFASFEDYWNPFLLGQGPAGAYVRRLNPDRLKLLREEVKRRLTVSDDGLPFDLPAWAWAVRGSVVSLTRSGGR
jgi:SAM-dependent methyltransferase